MDEPMKQIAISKFYGTEGSVYAACEAVLAEQKRRQAPKPEMTAAERDAFTRAQQEFDDGETVPAPAKERQMDATMADEVRQPAAICQHCGPVCLGGAAHNARREDGVRYEPADDVVERVAEVLRSEFYGSSVRPWKDFPFEYRQSWIRAADAALAVAREGMYSLEQVDEAVTMFLADRYNLSATGCYVAMQIIRARLTAQPTEQERVAAILRSHGFVARTAQDFADAIAELAALGKGGK